MGSGSIKTVYVDGACTLLGGPDDEGNYTGPGGWAWVEMRPDLSGVRFSRSGSETFTTNQRMEMTAALEAMKAFRDVETLVIVSDSAYVVNCFNDGWYGKWRMNGWKTSAGKPVANRDLWEQLLEEKERRRGKHTIWRHVRGHQADPGNIAADQKAVEAKQRVMADG